MAFLKEYPKGKKLISIQQATEIAGVSRRTIYNWITAERIDYCRTVSGSIRIVEDTLFRKTDEPAKISNLPLIGV